MDAIIGEIYESGEPFSVFGDKWERLLFGIFKSRTVYLTALL